MSEEKHAPYTEKRWTDIPTPKVTGHYEMTEDEKEQADLSFTQILRSNDVIGMDESVKGSEIIKTL